MSNERNSIIADGKVFLPPNGNSFLHNASDGLLTKNGNSFLADHKNPVLSSMTKRVSKELADQWMLSINGEDETEEDKKITLATAEKTMDFFRKLKPKTQRRLVQEYKDAEARLHYAYTYLSGGDTQQEESKGDNSWNSFDDSPTGRRLYSTVNFG